MTPDKSLFGKTDGRAGQMVHRLRLRWLDEIGGAIVATASTYPDGYRVRAHHHSQAQLLNAVAGIVMVQTGLGRWMIPPGYAIWIPPKVEHSVDILGEVTMHSVYVAPHAIEGLPETLRVVGLTGLMRGLIPVSR
jgi:quercetin dioxygenase-like cupin family protein